MQAQRMLLIGVIVIALAAWLAPPAIADECPERIDEANALIREAEQALAHGGAIADRGVLQEKLNAAKGWVDEAQTLHNSDDHDASVEKVYAALAVVKNVLKSLKP